MGLQVNIMAGAWTMRYIHFGAMILLVACTQGLDVGALVNPADAQRRGAVELRGKSDWPAILADVNRGGGPSLSAAMDAAQVPIADRPARSLQLRGDLALYEANPSALVSTLILYGS